MARGLPYDSDAGRDFAAAITALMTGAGYRQSARIAAARGAFEGFAANREPMLRVMRKHRLAECMLVEMLKMPWEEVHAEACRWEHVMSDAVELRLLEILGQPTVSPFGNPIPGLAELDPQGEHVLLSNEDVVSVVEVVGSDPVTLTVRRLAETIQLDEEVMARLRRVGALPGARVKAYQSGGGVFIGSGGEYTEVPLEEAVHIFVGA